MVIIQPGLVSRFIILMRHTGTLKIQLLLAALLAASQQTAADEPNINFDELAAGRYWELLYPYGGWTLYCGYRFEQDRKIDANRTVTIEHIYPTSRILKHLGCDSRMQCREAKNELFTQMEADMHNLYPVWHALVTYRYQLEFGEVPGEEWRTADCDIEWQGGVLEPRPLARGNIARSLLYMNLRYGVELSPEMIEMLSQWHRDDPPSNQEIDRNNKIETLQGVRNPFIDNPSLIKDAGELGSD